MSSSELLSSEPEREVVFPWQQSTLDLIEQQIQRQRLPHALLLQGAQGGGTNIFAWHVAKGLLCENLNPGLNACGTCRSCHLLEVGSHPNFKKISPEEMESGKISKVIKIDQIRQVMDSVQQTGFQAGRKVLIVSPAEAMNMNAANALLKSLEEPPKDTFFLLVSENPARLLATIRSRCQKIDLPQPSEQQAEQWLFSFIKEDAKRNKLLSLSNNNPLLVKLWVDRSQVDSVLQLEEDLLQVQQGRKSIFDTVTQWNKADGKDAGALQRIVWWWSLLSLQLKQHSASEQISTKNTLLFMDQLLASKRQLESTANPNEQLMLESLLIRWQKLSA